MTWLKWIIGTLRNLASWWQEDNTDPVPSEDEFSEDKSDGTAGMVDR